jgi:RHS repeat-associated protein
MKARAYLPEIGRFLQEDHYEAALGDQALETDPLTQDRYAFAGGNPTNNIEFDGHRYYGGSGTVAVRAPRRAVATRSQTATPDA